MRKQENMNKIEFIVVLITCPSQDNADKIKKLLLEKKAAACINIISAVHSSFWWQDKIDEAEEVLLLAKTKNDKFNEIVSLVKQAHKYEIPEIIALPIINGNKEYLEWIDEVTICPKQNG